MISFFAPMEPPETTAQQQKRLTVRGGHARAYTGAKGVAVNEALDFAFHTFAPKTPLAGPICLSIVITWPPKKCDINTKVKRLRFLGGNHISHVRKPDCDNAMKAILDSLQRLGFFTDDKQICKAIIEKRISTTPGIAVELSQI